MRLLIVQIILLAAIVILGSLWYQHSDNYCKTKYGGNHQFVYTRSGFAGCIEVKK